MTIRFLDSLPLSDRGLHYGDGLFETMCVSAGAVRLLEFHLERLALGAERLGLVLPDSAELYRAFEEAAAELGEGVLKLIVTRGSGGRGYLPPEIVSPSLILLRYPPMGVTADEVAARLCDLRLARQPRLAGIKHLNRLEYVLARAEWSDPAIGEGLLLDTEGFLVEGVVSNLFLVRGGRLLTPSLDHCGVDGVMRRHVMARAGTLGVPVEVKALGMEDLLGADEVFLTNSLSGIRAVTHLLDHRTWEAGPLTRQLRKGLWR
ncbi:MAG: aminodeoxychorismate lyase [Pseudomonadota bacterium]